MSYPIDLLATRSVIKTGLFAVIPKAGLVNNVMPFLQDCSTSVIASPKMGAGFVEYFNEVRPGGGTVCPFAAEEGIEGFIYLISGALKAESGGQIFDLTEGGYLYTPAGTGISFHNNGSEPAKMLMYKQKYIPFEGCHPYIYSGNTNAIKYSNYDEMENVFIKDLLPVELNFDMNFHILAFAPGGCHPIVETHVQEHGAYVLSGEGMYLLDGKWMGIRKDDYIWFGPYVSQAAYGVGRELFAYIYSKDCNRDVIL